MPLETLFSGCVAGFVLGNHDMTLVCIVDAHHVLEHPGKAVYCCCANDSAEAKQFITEQLDNIPGVCCRLFHSYLILPVASSTSFLEPPYPVLMSNSITIPSFVESGNA